MLTTLSVPLTLEPDAADLLTELGMQKELDQMLEQACRLIPNLQRLRLAYAEPYDTGIDPGILIEAYWNPEGQAPEPDIWDQYSAWKTTTFPPVVWTRFTLMMLDERNYVR